MAEIGRLLTAMVTPFGPDGAVDYDAAQRLATALLDSGSDGLVVAGTTGESATLTQDEKLRLFTAVKEAVGERGVVIGNTGTNATRQSVELTRAASRTGIDGVLAVTPYYNKPSQEGMFRHFQAIAGATTLPCILYNLPGRTSANTNDETQVRLSQIENVIGVKEASNDLRQISRIIEGAADGFRVWSGADEDTLLVLALGGYGVISVVSHLVGRQIRDMIDAAVGGRMDEAGRIHRRLQPLIFAMFVVSNPVPLKHVLGQLGFPVGGVRLPLCEPDAATADRIMEEVRRHQIDLPVAV